MEWDVSLRLIHRFHIFIDTQFDLNILHLSKATKKTGNFVTLSFPQTQHLQFAVFQGLEQLHIQERELNGNMYSSCELDGGERGFYFLFTQLMVWGGLEFQPLCFLFPF